MEVPNKNIKLATCTDSNNFICPSPPCSVTKAFPKRKFVPVAFIFILAYLDLGNFLCVIPFRCKFNNNKGQFDIVDFLPHKILVVIFHLSQTSYTAILYLRFLLKFQSSDDPLYFFRTLEALSDLYYGFIFTYLLVCKKKNFELFFKLAHAYHECEVKGTACKKYSMGFVVCLLYIILGSCYMWYGYLIGQMNLVPLSQSGPLAFINAVLQSGIGNILLSLLFGIWRAVNEEMSLLFFGFGWYLKQICEDLGRMIVTEEKSWNEILEHYLWVKQMNECINSITKHIILVYIVGCIPLISQGIIDFSFTQPRIIMKLVYAGIGFLFSMLGSAEANSQANQLKHRLLERQFSKIEKDTDTISLQMLLSEFSSSEIGLKGLHFFTVTYSFVGVMLSQCIVYALIILQLKGPASTS